MTRIENENGESLQIEGMQTEIEKLKKDLKRKQSKKFFNCGTCLVIFLLVIFVLGTMAAYVLAKSGLKTVPVFSDYFYRAPEPTYLVTRTKFDQNALISSFISAAEKEVLSQKKPENLSVPFELSDEEINALLLEQIAKDQSFRDRVDYWQIAVLPDNLEMFFKFKNPQNLILTLDIKPEINNGILNLSVRRFTLGNLNLPRFIGSILVENIGENIINKFLATISWLGKIEEISVNTKQVKLKVLINNFNNLSDAF